MRKLRFVLVFLLLAGLAVGPAAVLAQNYITVNGGPHVGILPYILTAFVQTNDILPTGPIENYVFTLFDTGSTRTGIDPYTAALLDGISGLVPPNIWIYGMSAIDPTILTKPTPAGPAQAEVLSIPVVMTDLPVTLIGGAVTNKVKAVIDYTKTITRGPYSERDGKIYNGPDITFYPAGGPVGYTPTITLNLLAFGSTSPDDPGKGQRYYMLNVSFNEGDLSWASPASGPISNASLQRFLFDTATTPTMLTRPLANALGLTGPKQFDVMVDGELCDGYYLDSITMTGADESIYTVLNAPVIVTDDVMGGAADAKIGSNIFSQVRLLFDGPTATLGIDKPSTANNPPVANAGEDQLIEATGPTTTFSLDGSGSSDPEDDADELEYSWKEDGIEAGTGAIITLSRGLGTYVFTLTVTDSGGLSSTDNVSITIVDTTPPALTPPADITVPESDPMGTPVAVGTAVVIDICDPSPSVTYSAPALFPLGTTTVIWTATDGSGNTSTAGQKVTVVPGTPLNQLSNLVKLINYSVAGGTIAPEMQTSLLAKINAAIAALVQGNPNATKVAMNDLKALVNQVEAQTDKKISPTVATEIITRANRIILALGG